MDYQASPIRQVRTWLEGFHQIQFDHWPLRWLYFIAGLAGCILIATGFIFWIASRRKSGVVPQPLKIRGVEAISVFSVTGIIVATGAFLVANRLLPMDTLWSDLARPELEVRIFFLTWVLTLFHAATRAGKAWSEQSWTIAALCVFAVILNWITTGDHVIAAAGRGLWSVAGMDLALLISAVVAAFSAMRLQRSPTSSPMPRNIPNQSLDMPAQNSRDSVDPEKTSPAE